MEEDWRGFWEILTYNGNSSTSMPFIPLHSTNSQTSPQGETTSFYKVNAALVIGGIKREKENTFIIRRHWSIVSIDNFLCYGRRVGFFHRAGMEKNHFSRPWLGGLGLARHCTAHQSKSHKPIGAWRIQEHARSRSDYWKWRFIPQRQGKWEIDFPVEMTVHPRPSLVYRVSFNLAWLVFLKKKEKKKRTGLAS
jgi:hypothetical protein